MEMMMKKMKKNTVKLKVLYINQVLFKIVNVNSILIFKMMLEIALLQQMMSVVRNVKVMRIWNLCYFVRNVDVQLDIVIVKHLILQIKYYVIHVEHINKDDYAFLNFYINNIL